MMRTDESSRNRECEDCGKVFTLCDEWADEGLKTAKALEGGCGFDPEINYIIASHCRDCYDNVIERAFRETEWESKHPLLSAVKEALDIFVGSVKRSLPF